MAEDSEDSISRNSDSTCKETRAPGEFMSHRSNMVEVTQGRDDRLLALGCGVGMEGYE